MSDLIQQIYAEAERIKARLAAVEKERDQAREENIRLRAALAHSELPCAYCSLPKDEWEKCAHGFPGCDRADDAMGCPELGASLQVHDLQAQLAAARRKVADRLGPDGKDWFLLELLEALSAVPRSGLDAATVEACARVAEAFDWYSAGMPANVDPKDVDALAEAIADDLRALVAPAPAEGDALTRQRDRLTEALLGARFKLGRYQECHPENYLGGLVAEYEAMISTIDAALAEGERS